MINFQKTSYYMFGIYLLLLSSLLLAEDALYLWDLGVKINSQSYVDKEVKLVEKTYGDANKKFAVLAKRHVAPKYVNVELKNDSKTTKATVQVDFSTLNYLERYNLGNKYFTSGRYVETIKLLEMVEFNKLDIKQQEHIMQLHADALFNLGHHNRLVNILTENKEYDLNDLLLFLLGMSSTKVGNKKIALQAFNQIIESYPNSEYKNIAKLQVRVLKR